jgi:hypothetical protein
MSPIIIQCVHCGTKTSGKYCLQCKTAEGRKEMDKNNKELNPEYKCKVCKEK